MNYCGAEALCYIKPSVHFIWEVSMTTRKQVLLIAALCLLALPLCAQVQKGDWELGVGAGYAWHGAELTDGWLGSVDAAYHFTPHWGLDFQLAYADSDVFELSRSRSTFRISGLYNLMPDQKMVPYVKFGAGWSAMKPDNFGQVFSGDKQVHLGLGVRRFLTPRVALKLEALAFYTYNATYENTHSWVLRTTTSPSPVPPPYPHPKYPYWDSVYGMDDHFMNYEVLVGFSFFPKRHPAPPPPPPPPPPPATQTCPDGSVILATEACPPPPPPPPPPPEPERG
jgi:hypothetical protein